MLVKIEARILIFPGTDFHFPSTSVLPGMFFRLWLLELGTTFVWCILGSLRLVDTVAYGKLLLQLS